MERPYPSMHHEQTFEQAAWRCVGILVLLVMAIIAAGLLWLLVSSSVGQKYCPPVKEWQPQTVPMPGKDGVVCLYKK